MWKIRSAFADRNTEDRGLEPGEVSLVRVSSSGELAGGRDVRSEVRRLDRAAQGVQVRGYA
jgi:hypothetical protein